MYKVSVPIMNENLKQNGREETLRELRRFDAERVFLALGFYEPDETKQQEIFENLKDNCAYFKSHGFEVGAWLWAFELPDNPQGFSGMRTVSGDDHPERICPTDKEFVRFSQNYIRNIAKCDVDIIMFDDDFCYNFLKGSPGCLCDNHIDMINDITGEKHCLEQLTELIMSGGKNKYRDAWLKANGDAIRNFAKEIRVAVDEINPKIRVGACACMSSWDIDGTNPDELSRILAGGTKPFYRLIGAPYWAVRSSFGCYLQDVIELERMESSFTRKSDVEIMAEGDAFPRPRYNCPANYLEGFDTAIRAAGCTDGILKYGLDYTSKPFYEQGYAVFHERNCEIYKGIDEMFSNKKHTGIRVYESMNKVAELKTVTTVNKTVDLEYQFQSKAARTLAHNTIPIVYEGAGVCGMVFDENARNMPLSALKNGLIIDIAAAEILTERGIDVGIKKIGNEYTGSVERFLDTDNKICHYFDPISVYDNQFSENIEVLSFFETGKGDIPLSYRYENKDGNRFLVFNINSRPNGEGRRKNTHFGPESVLRNYARSKQIAENITWLSGKKLPAYLYGYPEMYIQCKEKDGSLAVGLWNFFADTAIEPKIELAESYSKIKLLGCNGTLSENTVTLADIQPFGFAFFEVEK